MLFHLLSISSLREPLHGFVGTIFNPLTPTGIDKFSKWINHQPWPLLHQSHYTIPAKKYFLQCSVVAIFLSIQQVFPFFFQNKTFTIWVITFSWCLMNDIRIRDLLLILILLRKSFYFAHGVKFTVKFYPSWTTKNSTQDSQFEISSQQTQVFHK